MAVLKTGLEKTVNMELPSFLINSDSIYVVKIDPTGKIIFCNQRFSKRITGTITDLTGINMAQLISPGDLPKFQQVLNCITGPKNTNIPTELSLKNSSDDTIDIRWEFSTGSNDIIDTIEIVGIGYDVDEAGNRSIKESEEKYHALFEQASDPIMLTDFNGNFIDVNRNMCNMFGYSKEELLKMNIASLIDAEQLKTSPIRFDLLAVGEHIFSNRKMLHKCGDIIYVEANVKKFGENLIMAIARDVTELKKAEANLIAHEKQLMLFVEQSPAAIAMFDMDMRYLNVSRRWLTEYNISDKQLIGRIHYEVFPWIPQRWRDVHKRCLAGATEKSEEDSYINENGATDWLRWEVHPWHKASGEIGGIIMLTEVITEKKLLEAKILEQKVQEQKKISRAIIKTQERERNHIGQELHDNVNQILVGTKLYMKIAAQGNKAVEELIKYPMELIDTSIHEIRLLSSRQVTPLKNIRLKDLLHTLLDDLEKNTKLKTELNYDISRQSIDDDLKLNIYRIIQEQVNNIIKYAGAKHVNVFVLADNARINVSIADDGIGFNINKKRNGIGISNMINRVEAFNGEVVIESSPGKGTKVSITIPLGSAEV